MLVEKEPAVQSSVKKITEGGTARMLLENSPRRRLLLSFVGSARTVAQVAAAEAISIGEAHYVVRDLFRRGLLAVEREEKRAGRPIKHYRAVAAKFLVPLELASGSPGAGLASELRRRLDDEITRSESEGVTFFVDEHGEPRVSWFGRPGGQRTTAEFWQILKLTDSDARSLISELGTILERYQRLSGAGKHFLVHSAIVRRR